MLHSNTHTVQPMTTPKRARRADALLRLVVYFASHIGFEHMNDIFTCSLTSRWTRNICFTIQGFWNFERV